MRYKAAFFPSYILGQFISPSRFHPLTNSLDPESLEWNLFDDEYRHKLDQRKYVSLSRDRRTGVASAESADLSPSSGTTPAEETSPANDTTRERSRIFADDQDLEFDSEPSDDEDAEIPEGSLFDYHIPGVLTKEEVMKLDLDHWKLLVRNALVELEVIFSSVRPKSSLTPLTGS